MSRLSEQFAKMVNRIVAIEADTTLVNGQPIGSVWEDAESSRVQSFLQQNDLEKPVYTVTFAGDAVLSAPYNLADGSELTWVQTGIKAVVRRVIPGTFNETPIDVLAIVVVLGE